MTVQDWKRKLQKMGMTPEKARAYLEKKAAEGNPHAIAVLERIRKRQKANASTEKGTVPPKASH